MIDEEQAHAWIATTFHALADQLEAQPQENWDAASLCDGWPIRHVVAHVTMPARFSPTEFGAELAAAGGDFTRFSNGVAIRDGQRPTADLLGDLRSTQLHFWQPPGGGAVGALLHAVIHSLDVTLPLRLPSAAGEDSLTAVAEHLLAADGQIFGVNIVGLRLTATDRALSHGSGQPVEATTAELIALLSGRSLPDGRALPRA